MEHRISPLSPRKCSACGVHHKLCVCKQCHMVEGAPRLWVLQHPLELGHSKGTLRVAKACLPNLQVVVGEGGADFDELQPRIDTARGALLFPGSGSEGLESSHPCLSRDWILLDATWRKARKMLLMTPWLAALPRYEFTRPPSSSYRIRKGPNTSSLSTLEAIEHLITLTTPACDTAPLQEGLQALVQAQLSQIPVDIQHRYE
ncbi:tRNA-uridine aminocarboxypropyltransferase [Hydrocarboniclastica marina]|uniref:tRNA-uridine aminocarboxypropyltransferase n=1 Tax=Hydrocarboniclastica marina TaxID=2259620 RepID=UPI0015623A62|nr:tRNA-uridine aminocarboxypropyltransferase [Hydrocarboniclastica marina]